MKTTLVRCPAWLLMGPQPGRIMQLIRTNGAAMVAWSERGCDHPRCLSIDDSTADRLEREHAYVHPPRESCGHALGNRAGEPFVLPKGVRG